MRRRPFLLPLVAATLGLASTAALAPAVYAAGAHAGAPAAATAAAPGRVATQGQAIAYGHTQVTIDRRTSCTTLGGRRLCAADTRRADVPLAAHAHRSGVTAGRDYAFLATDAQGRPAHWNRCSPVRYRVNTAGAPSGSLAEVQTALGKVSAATGLRFSYAGSTSVVPFTDSAWANATPAAQSGDLYIAWSDEAHVSYLAGSVAGVGGPIYRSDGSREPQIIRGGVTLDRATRVARGFGAGVRSGTLLMHELGHTMNLGHVEDPTEVMYGTVNSASHGDYQAGDVAGMRALAAYTCF